MANFYSVKNNCLDLMFGPSYNKYRVSGPLTNEDVDYINKSGKFILIFDNTKEIDSKVVNRLNKENVFISVMGGINYLDKEDEFSKRDYINRTIYSPDGISKIINYYEEIEKCISDDWDEAKKAMYLYQALVSDNTTTISPNKYLEPGIAERSLNGLFFGNLVCAGFSLALKEGLDRLGIESHYQHKPGQHAWVIAKINGEYRGLEATWESTAKSNNDDIPFNYFGLDENFYDDPHHHIDLIISFDALDFEDSFFTPEYDDITDSSYSDQLYNIVPFTNEEIKINYDAISPYYSLRNNPLAGIKNNEELLIRVLPIDLLNLVASKTKNEMNMLILYNFLNNNDALSTEFIDEIERIVDNRKGILLDAHQSKDYVSGSDLEVKNLNGFYFNANGDISSKYGSIRKRTGINTLDDTILKKVCSTINNLIERICYDMLIDIINNVDSYIAKLNSNLESCLKTDILSRLNAFMESSNLLIEFGEDELKINSTLEKINNYFKAESKKHLDSEEKLNTRINDIDFYSSVFLFDDELRKEVELFEGRKITDEEWNTKCNQVNYMIKVFPFVEETELTNEDFKVILQLYKAYEDKLMTYEEVQSVLDNYINSVKIEMPKLS